MSVQKILELSNEDGATPAHLPAQTQNQPELSRNQRKNAHRLPDPLGLRPGQDKDGEVLEDHQAPDRRSDREDREVSVPDTQVRVLSPTMADIIVNLLKLEMWD